MTVYPEILLSASDWDEITARARATIAIHGDQPSTPGNYPDTIRGHLIGAAGEKALEMWLDRLGVRHAPDTATGSTWDRVTEGACLEIKTRSLRAHESWAWQVNTSTVNRCMNRETTRPGSVFIWAVYTGALGPQGEGRVRGVQLRGWALVKDTKNSPTVATSSMAAPLVMNHATDPALVRPMHVLADRLKHYDLMPV